MNAITAFEGKTMKSIVTAVVGLMATVSVAAAADLPSKKTTPAAPVAAAVTYPDSWYVGVNVGGSVKLDRNVTDNPASVGGVVGYKFNQMLALEAAVDQQMKKGADKAQTRGTVNAVVSPVGTHFGFTPYVLAGVGAQNHDFINNGIRDGSKAIYNVGGGVKYAISKNWEADARYRWVNRWSDNGKDANLATVGLNYKF